MKTSVWKIGIYAMLPALVCNVHGCFELVNGPYGYGFFGSWVIYKPFFKELTFSYAWLFVNLFCGLLLSILFYQADALNKVFMPLLISTTIFMLGPLVPIIFFPIGWIGMKAHNQELAMKMLSRPYFILVFWLLYRIGNSMPGPKTDKSK